MIRILLVDDQKVIRQGLKALLESESDLQVVGLAENGKIGIDIAEQLQPDVVLVDMYMPVMDGAAATEIICQRCPNTKVLLLSSADDDKCIADALRAGAMGYLLKNASSEEVADAIRSVHKGYTQLSPGLLKKVMERNTPSTSTSGVVSPDHTNAETKLLTLLKEPNRLDLQTLKSFQALVSSPADAKKLLPHLKQKLQRQPDHVGAYYLLGTLLYEHQQQAKVALTCWRKGFKQALDQGIPLEGLFLFCRSIFSVSDNDAYAGIKLIVETQEELISSSSLEQTAEQVFGSTSECFQFLTISWQIKKLHTLLDEHYPLKSKLDDLKIGFARLENKKQVYSL